MSAGGVLILMVIGIIIAIFGSYKLKMNSGVIAMIFAFLIGVFAVNMKVSGIIALWPVKVMFQLISVCLFFGYAIQNGALKWFAQEMMYKCRKVSWLVPFGMFFVTILLGCFAGAPPTTCAIMGAICFAIARQAGYNGLLIAFIAGTLPQVGSCLPIGVSGSIILNYMRENTTAFSDTAMSMSFRIWLCMFVSAFILFLILYFATGAFKVKNVVVDKPDPATPIQKKTLLLCLGVILLAIVPVLLDFLIDVSWLSTLTKFVDFQVCAILGAVVASLLKLGDEKKIINEVIPWRTIIMVGGITMLLCVAQQAGAVELMATWASTSLPKWLLAPVFTFVAGMLAVFSGAITVVFPMFAPLVEPLSASLGISAVALYASLAIGGVFVGVSPFSTGGALALAGSGEEGLRQDKLFNLMFGFAYLSLIVAIILAAVGFYNLF